MSLRSSTTRCRIRDAEILISKLTVRIFFWHRKLWIPENQSSASAVECQLMNIAKGGTLYQDIPSQTTGITGHSYGYIRTDVVHKVHVKDSSYLHEVFGTDELEVNSIHHQAVKDVGKDFTVTVTAPDGIVEGIEIPGKPIFAVQWHPEMLLKGSDKMLCIFEAFIKLCGN